jgi:hypothetical protein
LKKRSLRSRFKVLNHKPNPRRLPMFIITYREAARFSEALWEFPW